MRRFIRAQAEVLAVGAIAGRDGVFIDVAQDISVLILRKGRAHDPIASVRFPIVGLMPSNDPVVEQTLPIEPGDAWPLPAKDSGLVGGSRLADYGVTARAGYFVWNRETGRLVSKLGRKQRGYPLIWAKNVRPGDFCKPSTAAKLRSLVATMDDSLVTPERARYWIDLNNEIEKQLHDVVPHAPQDKTTFMRFTAALGISERIAANLWRWAIVAQRSHRVRFGSVFHDAFRGILTDPHAAMASNHDHTAQIRILRSMAEEHIAIVDKVRSYKAS